MARLRVQINKPPTRQPRRRMSLSYLSLSYLRSILSSIGPLLPATKEDRPYPEPVPRERATTTSSSDNVRFAGAEDQPSRTPTPEAHRDESSAPPAYLSHELEEDLRVNEHQDEFGGKLLSVEVVAQQINNWESLQLQRGDREMDQGLRLMGL